MFRSVAVCFLVAFALPALAADHCQPGEDALVAAMQAVVDSDALENAQTAEQCVAEAEEFRQLVAKVRDINGTLKGCPGALPDDKLQAIERIVTRTEDSIAGCAEIAAEKAARRQGGE